MLILTPVQKALLHRESKRGPETTLQKNISVYSLMKVFAADWKQKSVYLREQGAHFSRSSNR